MAKAARHMALCNPRAGSLVYTVYVSALLPRASTPQLAAPRPYPCPYPVYEVLLVQVVQRHYQAGRVEAQRPLAHHQLVMRMLATTT